MKFQKPNLIAEANTDGIPFFSELAYQDPLFPFNSLIPPLERLRSPTNFESFFKME